MHTFRIHNASVKFLDSDTTILSIHDATFEYGLNYITGRNGSGKTSLLRALTGRYDDIEISGKLSLEGHEYNSSGIGLVSQDPSRSICEELTFSDNLYLATISSHSWLSLRPLANKRRRKHIRAVLADIESETLLSSLFDRVAVDLSGGEKQLLAILMRVCRGNRILLLDECTASLDLANTRLIMSVLRRLANAKCYLIFVTHDEELINEYPAPRYIARSGQLLACDENGATR